MRIMYRLRKHKRLFAAVVAALLAGIMVLSLALPFII